MANSDVWINGFHLGHRPNGYVSFAYELTGHLLNFGHGVENILCVCADTSAQPASRWYAGAGIYRHVRLVVTDPVHIAADGVFVSTPEISSNQATVKIQTAVTNESRCVPFESHCRPRWCRRTARRSAAVQSSAEIAAAAATPSWNSKSFSRSRNSGISTPRIFTAPSREVRDKEKILDARDHVIRHSRCAISRPTPASG